VILRQLCEEFIHRSCQRFDLDFFNQQGYHLSSRRCMEEKYPLTGLANGIHSDEIDWIEIHICLWHEKLLVRWID
jgi:hypothetical protein